MVASGKSGGVQHLAGLLGKVGKVAAVQADAVFLQQHVLPFYISWNTRMALGTPDLRVS